MKTADSGLCTAMGRIGLLTVKTADSGLCTAMGRIGPLTVKTADSGLCTAMGRIGLTVKTADSGLCTAMGRIGLTVRDSNGRFISVNHIGLLAGRKAHWTLTIKKKITPCTWKEHIFHSERSIRLFFLQVKNTLNSLSFFLLLFFFFFFFCFFFCLFLFSFFLRDRRHWAITWREDIGLLLLLLLLLLFLKGAGHTAYFKGSELFARITGRENSILF